MRFALATARSWTFLGLFSACVPVVEPSPPPTVAAAPVFEEINSDLGQRRKAAKNSDLLLNEYDLNHDRRPDVFTYAKASPQSDGANRFTMVRKEIDLNHDGKVDIIRLYDDEEKVSEERLDLDFDGHLDVVALSQKGQLLEQQFDLNFDGKADLRKYYSAGALVRIETDRDLDGKVDAWEYYENGELDRIGLDNDDDGQVDSWERRQRAAQ